MLTNPLAAIIKQPGVVGCHFIQTMSVIMSSVVPLTSQISQRLISSLMFLWWRVRARGSDITVLLLSWLLLRLTTLQCKMVAVAVTIILPQYRICRLVEKPGAPSDRACPAHPPQIYIILCHGTLLTLPYLLPVSTTNIRHSQTNYIVALHALFYSQLLWTNLTEWDWPKVKPELIYLSGAA